MKTVLPLRNTVQTVDKTDPKEIFWGRFVILMDISHVLAHKTP
ncbi:hypothetical protein ABID49_002892, partial [Bhargavaea ullalensis]